jgi:hypothetical protein
MYTVDGTCFIYYNDGTSGQWVEQSKSILTPATYQSPNYIINGAFDFWQRGTSHSSVGYGSADRWFNNSSSTTVISRQTFTPGTAPVAGYEGQFFARVTKSANGSYSILEQRVEDVRTLAGETVTLSFWAKADSAVSVTPSFVQNFGSGGSAEVNVTEPAAQTIGTSWGRYSYTVPLPSLTGKTIGANSFLYVRALRIVDALARTVDIWGVQVEEGSVATPFRRSSPTLQAELAACQRYYQFHDFIVGSGDSAGYKFATNPLGQLLRATPTITATTTGGPSQSPVYSTAIAQGVLGKGGFANGAGATAGAYVIFTNVIVNAEL